MACEIVAETEEPLSRQSLADLVRRAQTTLSKKISRSTVWRVLDNDAIKPWQFKYWIFPRDPAFAEKARRILGWQPRVTFVELIRMMVAHDIDLARRERTMKQAGFADGARGAAMTGQD